MRNIFKVLILLTLLLTGCGTASTPTPDLIPTSTPLPTLTTESPTRTPTPTEIPNTPTPTHIPNAIPSEELATSLFHFHEANPVLQQSNNPAWDNLYIDPGGMVYHEGVFHMFFNGINGFPVPVGVGYATSPDGYHWTRQGDEPVLIAMQMNGSNILGSNLFVTSALVEDDGTWVLYFYTLRGSTFNGLGQIGRATATAPTGPWTIDLDPVLKPGSQGSWDDVQVTGPDVIKTDNGYVMYYDGHGSKTDSMIGMATSPDGIHWEKYNNPATIDPAFAESDPVLTTTPNSWDSVRVIDPNVVQTSDGWNMIYLVTTGSGKFSAGEFSFGLATSSDGIHWRKSEQNPILSNHDHSQWVATYLATLLYVNNTYYLYFDFVSSSTNGTNVYLATYNGPLK